MGAFHWNRYLRSAARCPVAEDAADRLLRLPFYTSMSDDELDLVIETLESFSAAT